MLLLGPHNAFNFIFQKKKEDDELLHDGISAAGLVEKTMLGKKRKRKAKNSGSFHI